MKMVFQILLMHRHIVKNMQMFGPRMHPSSFQVVFLLGNSIDNGELVLCEELKQEAHIVITVTNTVHVKDTHTGRRASPNSSVDVVKD